MKDEYEELVKIAGELRDLIFEDADDTMQGAMVGSPVECLGFAKWWIQQAKGVEPDEDHFRNDRPIAWADDRAMDGQVGNVVSSAEKDYLERGDWVARESAKQLRHPLWAAVVAQVDHE